MRLFLTSLLFIFIYNFSLAQSISEVSPNQAQQGDQLEITITGENTEWAQGTHVLLFKQGSTTIYPNPQTTINDTEIKGYFYFYSSHPVGDYDVRVEDWANGTEEVLEDGFNLLPGPQPEIVSIIPDSAEQVSAVTVTVTGENVDFEQSSSVLMFLKEGGVAIYAMSIFYPVDSVIEADFIFNTSHPTGLYDAVVTSYNETIVVEDGFEVLPATLFPEITSVDPDSAFQDTQFTMTIHGLDTHFDYPPYSNIVRLEGEYVTVNAITETAIDSVTLEAEFNLSYYHYPGIYNVVVINNLDGTMELEDGFTIIAGPDQPLITDVDPDTVMQSTEVWVTITGENINFNQGSYILNVEKDGYYIYPESQTVLNDSMMKGDFFFNPDQPEDDYNIQLDGSSAWLEDGLHVLPPENTPSLLSIYPDTAIQGQTATFILVAENTHFDDPEIENNVYLYDGSSLFYVAEVSVISDDTIQFSYTFYAYHILGMYDVKVINDLDGSMVLQDAFMLLPAGEAPLITDIDPDHADRGESLWVTISGENTYFMLGSATIKFVQGSSTIYPTTENVLSDTLIEGDFTFDLSYPVGFYDVFVYDIHGSWSVSKEEGFYLYEETAVEELDRGEPGRIYPNPANNKVFIERNPHNRKGIAIDILNMSGKTVRLAEMTSSEQLVEIDISDFEKGIYLVKLRCGDKISIKKLVVR